MATEPEPDAEQKGFKRLNFFKGLVTYYSDWIDNEKYRVEKHRWHNRHLHSPGVVVGYESELAVTSRGDLSFEVQPGCAIDGQGNELLVWDTQIKHVHPEQFKLPQTVYLVLRYAEEQTDFISYKQNLAIKGHKRILETSKVEISPLLPNVNKEVELARILLDKDVHALKDAQDPRNPQANEIDLRYVLRSGRGGSGLDRQTQIAIGSMLRGMRQSLSTLGRIGRVMTAHDALAAVIGASAVHAAQLTDPRNLLDMFATLFEMQVAIYVELKLNHPHLATTPQFKEWLGALRGLRAVLMERNPPRERLLMAASVQHRLNAILQAMFASAATRAL